MSFIFSAPTVEGSTKTGQGQYLHDVSRTLGSRRQFQSDQRMLGLGRGASAGLAGSLDFGGFGMGHGGFFVPYGVTFEWEEVQLLAKLGGWEPHKDRKPGKITLMRGLRRLIDLLATQGVLSQYVSQHESLPPNINAFLQGWTPPNEL